MSHDPQVHQQLGSLDARADGMDKRMDAVEKKLDAVLAILNQTKGGWKTLVILASVAGAVGAVAAKFLPLLFAAPVPR